MVIDPPNPIAHLKPTQASSAISGHRFSIGAIVFPCRDDDADMRLEPVSPGQTFALLSQYGINYRTVGRKAFDAGVRLVQQCPAYRLHYRDAAEAEKMLRESPSLPCATTGEPHVPDRVHAAPANSAAMSHCRVRAESEFTLEPMLHAFADPASLRSASLTEWDTLWVVANHADCLTRLARKLQQHEVWQSIPHDVRVRLEHELQRYYFNRKSIQFELMQLAASVPQFADKIVLLKGAAYVAADFGWADGERRVTWMYWSMSLY